MIKALSVSLLLASPLCGALSPLNQSTKEIEAIVKSQALDHHLSQSERIQSITRIEEGYLITTNDSQMLVRVEYLPSEGVGPQRFELKFHQPHSLKKEDTL